MDALKRGAHGAMHMFQRTPHFPADTARSSNTAHCWRAAACGYLARCPSSCYRLAAHATLAPSAPLEAPLGCCRPRWAQRPHSRPATRRPRPRLPATRAVHRQICGKSSSSSGWRRRRHTDDMEHTCSATAWLSQQSICTGSRTCSGGCGARSRPFGLAAVRTGACGPRQGWCLGRCGWMAACARPAHN